MKGQTGMMGRVLAVFLLFSTAAQAQAPAPPPAPDKTTSQTLRLPGGTLEFQAQVSTIRLANPQGAPQAEVVTTAFMLAGADPATRPVTFGITGGPGASWVWLTLGGVGPWGGPFGGGPIGPGRPPEPGDNAQTWLDFPDLVFIDPPGTGYSRVVAQGD